MRNANYIEKFASVAFVQRSKVASRGKLNVYISVVTFWVDAV